MYKASVAPAPGGIEGEMAWRESAPERIALGAGAFFTGFLLYILKFKELKAVINSAVVM